jgi:hypothetical protein
MFSVTIISALFHNDLFFVIFYLAYSSAIALLFIYLLISVRFLCSIQSVTTTSHTTTSLALAMRISLMPRSPNHYHNNGTLRKPTGSGTNSNDRSSVYAAVPQRLTVETVDPATPSALPSFSGTGGVANGTNGSIGSPVTTTTTTITPIPTTTTTTNAVITAATTTNNNNNGNGLGVGWRPLISLPTIPLGLLGPGSARSSLVLTPTANSSRSNASTITVMTTTVSSTSAGSSGSGGGSLMHGSPHVGGRRSVVSLPMTPKGNGNGIPSPYLAPTTSAPTLTLSLPFGDRAFLAPPISGRTDRASSIGSVSGLSVNTTTSSGPPTATGPNPNGVSSIVIPPPSPHSTSHILPIPLTPSSGMGGTSSTNGMGGNGGGGGSTSLAAGNSPGSMAGGSFAPGSSRVSVGGGVAGSSPDQSHPHHQHHYHHHHHSSNGSTGSIGGSIGSAAALTTMAGSSPVTGVGAPVVFPPPVPSVPSVPPPLNHLPSTQSAPPTTGRNGRSNPSTVQSAHRNGTSTVGMGNGPLPGTITNGNGRSNRRSHHRKQALFQTIMIATRRQMHRLALYDVVITSLAIIVLSLRSWWLYALPSQSAQNYLLVAIVYEFFRCMWALTLTLSLWPQSIAHLLPVSASTISPLTDIAPIQPSESVSMSASAVADLRGV